MFTGTSNTRGPHTRAIEVSNVTTCWWFLTNLSTDKSWCRFSKQDCTLVTLRVLCTLFSRNVGTVNNGAGDSSRQPCVRDGAHGPWGTTDVFNVSLLSFVSIFKSEALGCFRWLVVPLRGLKFVFTVGLVDGRCRSRVRCTRRSSSVCGPGGTSCVLRLIVNISLSLLRCAQVCLAFVV